MQEIWKDIPNYEGLYQISNLGRVKSIKNNIIKKPSILKKGYLNMCLRKNGKAKYILIHRLVALAYIPNPNNFPCVNHKDCNPQNNRVDNLEWITYKENNNYKNHNLKKNITCLLYYLKKDYSKETMLIKELEKFKNKVK